MPYVPSKKTDGVSDDRNTLDQAVERAATEAAGSITDNLSLIKVYGNIFFGVASTLNHLVRKEYPVRMPDDSAFCLATAIFNIARKYNYGGAYLGELNYAITRFIQRVPQIKVVSGAWNTSDEFRYWLYACTVEALTKAATEWQNVGIGIGGVFEDIKDEYKRRVNTAYEAAQILKSGDCYDTPYYTRLVPVLDEYLNAIGHIEVMLKRDKATIGVDVLPYQIFVRKTQ